MAITEFEPINGFTDPAEQVAPEVVEKSPFEIFKDGLHEMVTAIEGQGQSALSSLLAIREELKDARRILMTESLRLEQLLKESNYESPEVMTQLSANQEEQILIYHKHEWLEGYIRARQN